MKKLMAANWKMFKTSEEAFATAKGLAENVAAKLPEDREMLIFPPFTAIANVKEALEGQDRMFWGAQNFHPAEEGAFTGEISPRMLKPLGCTHLLTGHSERRHVFGENDATVAAKTSYALEEGFSAVFCIGEKIEERKAGQVEEVLRRQIEIGLADVPRDIAPERLVVAYEPVWAIGTGEVAEPEDIVHAHLFTRKVLSEIFGANADAMRILYGGSVKPGNASAIIALDNVDGVLVGGASLAVDAFTEIVLA